MCIRTYYKIVCIIYTILHYIPLFISVNLFIYAKVSYKYFSYYIITSDDVCLCLEYNYSNYIKISYYLFIIFVILFIINFILGYIWSYINFSYNKDTNDIIYTDDISYSMLNPAESRL